MNQIQVESNDYDFVKLFDVQHLIGDQSIQLENILTILQKILSEDEVRIIINLGIKHYCKRPQNYKFIKSIHDQLESHNNTIQCQDDIIPTPSNDDGSSETKTHSRICNIALTELLRIQSIVCKIFSYLDFKSLMKCGRVNNQWLRDSYEPSSVYHIDTQNLYRRNRYHFYKNALFYSDDDEGDDTRPRSHYQTFRSIMRFRHARSLTMHSWPLALGYYFKQISKTFSKVEKLELIQQKTAALFGDENEVWHQDVCQQIINIIQNNVSQIQSITMENVQLSSTARNLTVGASVSGINIEPLKFLNLREICLTSMKLYTFGFDLTNNHNRLRKFSLIGVETTLIFWRGLCNSINNMCHGWNVEELHFDTVNIERHNKECFQKEIIPNLGPKLVNLKVFKCINRYGRLMNKYIDTQKKFLLSHAIGDWVDHIGNAMKDKKNGNQVNVKDNRKKVIVDVLETDICLDEIKERELQHERFVKSKRLSLKIGTKDKRKTLCKMEEKFLSRMISHDICERLTIGNEEKKDGFKLSPVNLLSILNVYEKTFKKLQYIEIDELNVISQNSSNGLINVMEMIEILRQQMEKIKFIRKEEEEKEDYCDDYRIKLTKLRAIFSLKFKHIVDFTKSQTRKIIDLLSKWYLSDDIYVSIQFKCESGKEDLGLLRYDSKWIENLVYKIENIPKQCRFQKATIVHNEKHIKPPVKPKRKRNVLFSDDDIDSWTPPAPVVHNYINNDEIKETTPNDLGVNAKQEEKKKKNINDNSKDIGSMFDSDSEDDPLFETSTWARQTQKNEIIQEKNNENSTGQEKSTDSKDIGGIFDSDSDSDSNSQDDPLFGTSTLEEKSKDSKDIVKSRHLGDMFDSDSDLNLYLKNGSAIADNKNGDKVNKWKGMFDSDSDDIDTLFAPVKGRKVGGGDLNKKDKFQSKFEEYEYGNMTHLFVETSTFPVHELILTIQRLKNGCRYQFQKENIQNNRKPRKKGAIFFDDSDDDW